MRKSKIVKYSLAALAAIVITAGIAAWRIHRSLPESIKRDLRAAIGARGSARPLDRFMELRYGPMNNPDNRRAAFTNFFDLDHMKGLQILTTHMKPEQRRTNILATADWIASYRENMTTEEKLVLSNCLNSPEGIRMIRQSTSQYLSRDVAYRAAIAPVITELMTTLSSLKTP